MQLANLTAPATGDCAPELGLSVAVVVVVVPRPATPFGGDFDPPQPPASIPRLDSPGGEHSSAECNASAAHSVSEADPSKATLKRAIRAVDGETRGLCERPLAGASGALT